MFNCPDKSFDELQSNLVTHFLCQWIKSHNDNEPDIDSEDEVESMLAFWLHEMRIANAQQR